jgi:RND superfamily putative drug exporter
MFAALGRLTYRRRRLVALIWLAILAVGMAVSGLAQKRLSAEFEGSARFESEKVAQTLDAIDARGEEIVAVVDGRAVDDPGLRNEILAAIADVRGVPGVLAVADHWSTGDPALVATDGRASAVVVVLASGLSAQQEEEAAHAVAERLRRIDARGVKVGGAALVGEEFHDAVEKDLQRGETSALPVALIALVVIFGGLLAAALPLAIAFLAVSGAMVVLVAATSIMGVSVFALNVVYMLGIGLGIDYGLLLVSRFREERAAGLDIRDAVERTVESAGRTVAFSALTVAVALSGLFAFDNPTFRSFGVAGIGVVLLSMAAATTLLPALLAMWGRRSSTSR